MKTELCDDAQFQLKIFVATGPTDPDKEKFCPDSQQGDQQSS